MSPSSPNKIQTIHNLFVYLWIITKFNRNFSNQFRAPINFNSSEFELKNKIFNCTQVFFYFCHAIFGFYYYVLLLLLLEIKHHTYWSSVKYEQSICNFERRKNHDGMLDFILYSISFAWQFASIISEESIMCIFHKRSRQIQWYCTMVLVHNECIAFVHTLQNDFVNEKKKLGQGCLEKVM